MKNACSGCRYWIPLNGYDRRMICYYIVMEKRRRPCPPGEGCLVRAETEMA